MIVTFSEHLAQLLAHEGMSNAELARKIGVSHVSIGNYLNGRVPRYEVAEKMAKVFGVTPDYLLNPAKYKKPFELAKQAAANCKGTQKEKDDVFNRVASIEGSKLRVWQEGFEASRDVMKEEALEYGGVDWRERALTAEKKLANLRVKLGEMLKEL